MSRGCKVMAVKETLNVGKWDKRNLRFGIG